MRCRWRRGRESTRTKKKAREGKGNVKLNELRDAQPELERSDWRPSTPPLWGFRMRELGVGIGFGREQRAGMREGEYGERGELASLSSKQGRRGEEGKEGTNGLIWVVGEQRRQSGRVLSYEVRVKK